jgi:hypothetical protein
VPKLGPIEWVFNTPSHHRAHHGINPRYIDKSYAGILIIWDRLFGTFEAESEPVVYGTVEPLRSFDPLWAQVHPWVQLARGAIRAPRFADKIRIWFAPPEWSPEGVPPHAAPGPVSPGTRPKWEQASSPLAAAHVFALLTGAVVATFALLFAGGALAPRDLGLAVAGVLGTLFAGAALVEKRPWAWPLELGWVVIAGVVGVGVARGL